MIVIDLWVIFASPLHYHTTVITIIMNNTTAMTTAGLCHPWPCNATATINITINTTIINMIAIMTVVSMTVATATLYGGTL